MLFGRFGAFSPAVYRLPVEAADVHPRLRAFRPLDSKWGCSGSRDAQRSASGRDPLRVAAKLTEQRFFSLFEGAGRTKKFNRYHLSRPAVTPG